MGMMMVFGFLQEPRAVSAPFKHYGYERDNYVTHG
jgi:hypothetical protein